MDDRRRGAFRLAATARRRAAAWGGSWRRDATIVVGAGAVVYLTIATLPTALVGQAAAEHGVVETATAVLFATAVVLSALAARRRLWESGYLAAVMFTVAVMRELDFHKAFTSRSITRGVGIGFIASPVVPWIEKVLVVLVGTAVLAAVVVCFRREWPRFQLGLRARSRPVMLTLVGLALLVVAAVLDDTYGRVKALGPAVATRWQLLEEFLELQAAAIFVVALLPALLTSPSAEEAGARTTGSADRSSAGAVAGSSGRSR